MRSKSQTQIKINLSCIQCITGRLSNHIFSISYLQVKHYGKDNLKIAKNQARCQITKPQVAIKEKISFKSCCHKGLETSERLELSSRGKVKLVSLSPMGAHPLPSWRTLILHTDTQLLLALMVFIAQLEKKHTFLSLHVISSTLCYHEEAWLRIETDIQFFQDIWLYFSISFSSIKKGPDSSCCFNYAGFEMLQDQEK